MIYGEYSQYNFIFMPCPQYDEAMLRPALLLAPLAPQPMVSSTKR